MRRADGILFQTPLVEAILRDAEPKTQTRRVAVPVEHHEIKLLDLSMLKTQATFQHPKLDRPIVAKARGWPGTLWWVREAWNIGKAPGLEGPQIRWRALSPFDRSLLDEWNRRGNLTGPAKQTSVCHTLKVPPLAAVPKVDADVFARFRPGIHLPQWAARIWLEVLDTRVQRVQEITEEDARAEGVEAAWNSARYSYVLGFRKVWDQINGDRPGCSWESNPWVFAYTFRRTERPR